MRAARLGLEAQNSAAEIKLRAERKAGEMLAGLERQPGPGRGHTAEKISISGNLLYDYRSVLEETDTPYQTANRWQKIAALPGDQFEEYIAETKAERAELTTTGILRFERELARAAVAQERQNAPPLPSGKYRVFYADPPWSYGNSGVIGPTDNYGHVHRHYPSMSIAELCAMGPAVLGLWWDRVFWRIGRPLRGAVLRLGEPQHLKDASRALDAPQFVCAQVAAPHETTDQLVGPLADEDVRRHEGLAAPPCALPGFAQRSSRAQAGGQLATKCTAARHVQCLVDRFVADAHGGVVGEVDQQPVRDLFWTPCSCPPPRLPASEATPLPGGRMSVRTA